jgi:hypothetical protein
LGLGLPIVGGVVDTLPNDSAITVSAVEYSAETDFAFSYDTTNMTATITKYVGEGTEVVIPPTIMNGRYTVTTIGEKAFLDSSETITSIVIPSTITTIEDYALGMYKNYSEGIYESALSSYYKVNNNLKVTCSSTTNEDVLFEYASRDFIVKRKGFITTEYDNLTFKYDVENKTASIVKYFGEDEDLVIPATINGKYNVTGIEDYAIGIYSYVGGAYDSVLKDYISVYNELQIYYSNPDIEGALLEYLSKDYITSRGGMKMPIYTEAEPVEPVQPSTTYDCDVNKDGVVNIVDLLIVKRTIMGLI